MLEQQAGSSLPGTSNLGFSSFEISSSESQIAEKVNMLLFDYFFLKESCCLTDNNLVDLKSFCGMSFKDMPKSQPSNVVYLSIVDMHADSKEAMEAVVTKLHAEYGVGVTSQNLVVVGDPAAFRNSNMPMVLS